MDSQTEIVDVLGRQQGIYLFQPDENSDHMVFIRYQLQNGVTRPFLKGGLERMFVVGRRMHLSESFSEPGGKRCPRRPRTDIFNFP